MKTAKRKIASGRRGGEKDGGGKIRRLELARLRAEEAESESFGAAFEEALGDAWGGEDVPEDLSDER